MGIYQENGYLDMRKIMSYNYRNIFVYGGRGSGKSYNALKCLIEDRIPFLYLRRTQAQLDTLCLAQFNPFKSLNTNCGWNVVMQRAGKYGSVITDGDDESVVYGYGAALSTFANIRSFGGDDVQIILYEEFIPEKHQKQIRDEYGALMNLYESINRNRELEGKPYVKLIGLTNSNDIASPIFTGMQLIRTIERMKKRGVEMMASPDGDTLLIDTMYSKILKQKAQTSFYANKNDSFSRMAVSGTFDRISSSVIKSQPLSEYKPVAAIGEVAIYKHKSRHAFYCCGHVAGAMPTYGTNDVDIKRFLNRHIWLKMAYINGNIIFDSEETEIILTSYIGV